MNTKRRENMVSVILERRILMRHGESRGTGTRQRTPPHSTTTFSHRRKA